MLHPALLSLPRSMRYRLAFKYTPGDSLVNAGATFSRGSTATYIDANGLLQSASSGAARDGHYIAGVRSLWLEGQRTNGRTFANDFTNAVWSPSATTVSAGTGSAPGPAVASTKLLETIATAQHLVFATAPTNTANTSQPLLWLVAPGERTWCYVQTNLSGGAVPQSWVNLSTGAVGTKAAQHTIRTTVFTTGWVLIECVVAPGAANTVTVSGLGIATGDNISSYTGVATNGIYIAHHQHEVDQAFAASIIPTTTVAVTRSADSLYFPWAFTGDQTLYFKAVNLGTHQIGGYYLNVGAGATAPRFTVYNPGANLLGIFESNGTSTATPQASSVVAIGDIIEGRGTISAASALIGSAVNAAAETTNSVAGVSAPAAWSANRLAIGATDLGTQSGFAAFQSIKGALAYNKSLADMRAA